MASDGKPIMRHKPAALGALLLSAVLLPLSSARASEVLLGQSGGIYTATGQINRSVTLQFLVDPGSAVVVIPRSVLDQLILNGSITQDDVIGISIAELADRSLYRAVQLRLRELRVGNSVARDVIAAVAPGLSHALLGQTFLGRFASVTFDNQRHVLILSDSALAAAPRYPGSPPNPPFYGPSAAPGAYSQPSYWPTMR